MGRQKFGGSRSKIRGKVGSTIYQVVRDGDGFAQYAYAAPEHRTNPNTREQALARMIMGHIQRMFHALPNIIKEAFADTDTGRMSFQRFAQVNYPLLKQDIDNHWSGGGDFDWQYKYKVLPPAGSWILSNGCLKPFFCDDFSTSLDMNNEFEWNWFFDFNDITIGQWFQRMNMKMGDTLMLFFFRKNTLDEVPYIEQLTLRLNDAYDENTLISDTFFEDILIGGGEWDVIVTADEGNSYVNMTIYHSHAVSPYYIACCAPMIVRPTDRGTLFSSTRFQWSTKDSKYWRGKTPPDIAFVSWSKND